MHTYKRGTDHRIVLIAGRTGNAALRPRLRISWRSLNSYVHGGIHALKRGEDGFPLWLAIQILRTSNGLMTMAAAMLSKLSGEDRGLADINRLLPQFKECLPELRPTKKP